MSEVTGRDRMLDLLADKAVFGLSEEEKAELGRLERQFPELAGDESFEAAAAAFSLNGLEITGQMPASLRAGLAAEGRRLVSGRNAVKAEAEPDEPASNIIPVEFDRPRLSFAQWLGWGVAAVACVALAISIWSGQTAAPVDNTAGTREIKEEREPTATENRDALIAQARDVIRTEWTSPANDEELSGEIVWSDSRQEGFMTFRGLPENPKDKETYQLWIFDETQDDKTPIDGGIFDIEKDGEVVIPIDAKLKVRNPKMFAVTVEKPGGVVVSDREKIVALAQIKSA